MNKTQMNLQDLFLNQARKENIGVTIYLVGGVQLKGHVRGFDVFTVLLETPGKPTQLIYKHAIASVVPGRPVRLPQKEEAEQRETAVETAETAQAAEKAEEPVEPALPAESEELAEPQPAETG